MSLRRLFWIVGDFTPAEGGYVRYPFASMLETLANVSQARRALVIGEDLGIVPIGFREAMRAAEVQGYRVLFFEKQDDRFIPPAFYPRETLACLTTHDLHTLAGWWSGHDIATRTAIGMIEAADVPAAQAVRAHERRRLLGLLEEHGLLPEEAAPVMRGEAAPASDLPPVLAVALHRLIARTPSRLVAVPLEDLVGEREQVNMPGTVEEHPNWRRRLPVTLEALPTHPLFQSIGAALREERPRST
jgi:4-alpha-glucanotransferase